MFIIKGCSGSSKRLYCWYNNGYGHRHKGLQGCSYLEFRNGASFRSEVPATSVPCVDGGFDNHEAEYEEEYCIVILPDYANLPYPSVDLPEKVKLVVDAVVRAEGAELKEQVASWTADKKLISEHALTLQQIAKKRSILNFIFDRLGLDRMYYV